MADNLFADEMRKILEKTTNPGPMYDGWENPTNRADQKGPNGVYATPYDREGGNEIANQELEMQARDIVARFVGNPENNREAVEKVLDILRGKGQSPADQDGHAPLVGAQPGVQFQYGSNLSAPPTGVDAKEWARFQAFRAAEEEEKKDDEREEKKKKRRDDDDDDDDDEDKAMSVIGSRRFQRQLAQMIAPVIESTVRAEVHAALSASVPSHASSPSPYSNETGVRVGAQQQPGAWRDLPGVAAPANQMQAAASADGVSPYQQAADKFIRMAKEKEMSLPDPMQKQRFAESVRHTYAAILSGRSFSVDEPLLQNLLDATGIRYEQSGIGGGM